MASILPWQADKPSIMEHNGNSSNDQDLRSGTANSGMDDAGMASNIHDAEATSATYAATTAPVEHVSGATGLNNAGQGYAADNNFEGDAFRASAGMGQKPDTQYAPTKDTYSGITAIGGYDQNADTAVVGGLGTNSTPGVRSDTPLPGAQSGTDESHIFNRDADALSGDHTGVKTSGEVLNDPSQSIADALRNAGSNIEGHIHGVVGDVTHSGSGGNTSGA